MKQQLPPISEPTFCSDHTKEHKSLAKLQVIFVLIVNKFILNGLTHKNEGQ